MSNLVNTIDHDEDDEQNWIIKLAQHIRDANSDVAIENIASDGNYYDPLKDPAVQRLAELVDRCGTDIAPAYLEGYANALFIAEIIDTIVLKAIIKHVHLMENIDTDDSAAGEIFSH
ncbi:hypothetical protein [Massilia phyllosphaerae]|uniref:hypothetical protein n=1 Tax=Massilia phyllosphaerae TaxID=3106034 RepID=UPI002B1CC4BB|nr:hypothetical protein [Massilia sp. SGZ-792]